MVNELASSYKGLVIENFQQQTKTNHICTLRFNCRIAFVLYLFRRRIQIIQDRIQVRNCEYSI